MYDKVKVGSSIVGPGARSMHASVSGWITSRHEMMYEIAKH